MERRIEYTISDKEAGNTIYEYLHKLGYMRSAFIHLKHSTDGVTVKSIAEDDFSHRRLKDTLYEGDILKIYINETDVSQNIPAVEIPLDIKYEDEDIVVINKPCNMPIHPSLNNYDNSLANGLAWYYSSMNKPFVFRCCNRLDKDTSGLTLIAKNLLSAEILGKMAQNKEIEREYLAIVDGVIPDDAKSGCIDAPIARKDGSIIERIVDYDHGERAVTNYEVLSESQNVSLVHLILETGRTHQIRVHMKHIGHPLIGDYIYNPDMRYINRQALHSWRLKFVHPITKELMQFEAPLPEDMERALNQNVE